MVNLRAAIILLCATTLPAVTPSRQSSDDFIRQIQQMILGGQPTKSTQPLQTVKPTALQQTVRPTQPQPIIPKLPAQPPAVAKCPHGIRPRKEVRDLTPDEWNRFVTAMKKVKQSGYFDQLSKWHYQFANANSIQDGLIHNTPLFFPWHRAQLIKLELELQKHDSSVMVPFWDWSYDSQAIEMSTVVSAKYYGSIKKTECVSDGAFAKWQVPHAGDDAHPNPHCLVRNYGRRTAIAPVDQLHRIIMGARSLQEFQRTVEGIHGGIHVIIGGDMESFHSPNDPIFYAHHAFIDKLWMTWQLRKDVDPKSYSADPNQTFQPAEWKVKVSDVFDTRALCYTYAEFQNKPQPSGTPIRKRDLTSLRRRAGNFEDDIVELYEVDSESAAKPANPESRAALARLREVPMLPEKWIALNRLNATETTQVFNEMNKLIHDVNALPGYISPCALWNREDMLEKIVTEESTLKVVVNNTRVVVKVEKNVSPYEAMVIAKQTIRRSLGVTYLRSPVASFAKDLAKIVGPPLPINSPVTALYKPTKLDKDIADGVAKPVKRTEKPAPRGKPEGKGKPEAQGYAQQPPKGQGQAKGQGKGKGY